MKFRFFLFILLAAVACTNNTSTSNTENQTNETTTSTEGQYNQEEEVKREPHFIEQKNWVLESYSYEGKEIPLNQITERPTINFDHLKVNGFGACNSFFGTLSFDDKGAMKISQLAKSKKMCSKTMSTESRVMELLEAVQSYENNLLHLTLDAGDKGYLKYLLKE